MTKEMPESQMFDLVCSKRFDHIDKKLDLLLGKVLNDDPSIMMRVDRLEQTHKSAVRAFWMAASALLTAICGTIWGIITGSR